jgi:NADPH-dependent 2,4-dienoyl-CoA reductase/sulfur reductase-like enzyme
MVNHVVIVRASLAGAAAAATLREEGFDGSVTVIGAEIHAPYGKVRAIPSKESGWIEGW